MKYHTMTRGKKN